MKKKVLLSLAATAMVGTLAVGGTLAWFTDTETATNVVTVGNVDIVLNEDGGADGAVTESGLVYSDLMPGKVYDKLVTIENKGNDAYVRAIVTISGEKVVGTLLDENTDNDIIFDGLLKDANWVVSEDKKTASCTVVRDGRFTNTDEAWTVFENFTIPGSWNNDFENADFNIKVEAQAIQADNVTEEDAWTNFSVDNGNKATDEIGNISGGAAVIVETTAAE